MDLTVVMTVYNRPYMVLMNTFIALARALKPGCKVLVIDDGSDKDFMRDYKEIRSIVEEWGVPLEWKRISTSNDRPETYHIDGHNNPAYVNNRALEMTDTEDLCWLSSDCIVPPNAFEVIEKYDLSTTVVTTRVIDLDTAAVFLGASRLFPMCWFLTMKTAHCREIGGFDEEFIKGMAYEDNDFAGRLCLHVGKLAIDQSATVWHQSHPPAAYSDDLVGFKKSGAYTSERWSGHAPFNGKEVPVAFKSNAVGNVVFLTEFKYTGGHDSAPQLQAQEAGVVGSDHGAT